MFSILEDRLVEMAGFLLLESLIQYLKIALVRIDPDILKCFFNRMPNGLSGIAGATGSRQEVFTSTNLIVHCCDNKGVCFRTSRTPKVEPALRG